MHLTRSTPDCLDIPPGSGLQLGNWFTRIENRLGESPALQLRQPDRPHLVNRAYGRFMHTGDDKIGERPTLEFGRTEKQVLLIWRNPRLELYGLGMTLWSRMLGGPLL
jgi:hypothetical protein